MYCPNSECPNLSSTGVPAEFREDITECPECGAELLPGDAPNADPESSEVESPVTVALYEEPDAARAAREILERAGIEAQIEDDGHLADGHLAGATSLLTGNAPVIKLTTCRSDAEAASIVLKEKPSSSGERVLEVTPDRWSRRPLLISIGMILSLLFGTLILLVLSMSILSSEGTTATFEINGQPVTKEAFLWKAALPMALFAGACYLIAYSFWRERPWARELVLLFNVSPPILLAVQVGFAAGCASGLTQLPLIAFSVWYFYGKKNVASYYRELKKGKPRTSGRA